MVAGPANRGISFPPSGWLNRLIASLGEPFRDAFNLAPPRSAASPFFAGGATLCPLRGVRARRIIRTMQTELAKRLTAIGIEPALARRLAGEGRAVRVPDGAELFAPGMACEAFVILLEGSVRVEHLASSGRAMTLYRVEPGGTCIMTTACLLSHDPYAAEGRAEGETEILVIPHGAFERLMAEEPGFRRMTLAAFANRLQDLVEVIEELMVRRVDLRLAAWLAERGTAPVALTHQAIAAELGTAREVVSRLLKEFERRGLVALARGEVRVLDAPALMRLSAG
jgi:CRP/FNR family transcriptional regulator